ncbi:RidA family protein [Spelaeicoccus albus]|uniref:Enamine deaminase RidA (YjgF/YER057c/UK114 family) n=1 Tax=Spelaeicoccus albus TaxID=1280376 RepID=A0A7Z0D1A1_9MICO|nr:RidA family protein [Spelaeicoccus albus]NYI65740.1 enamine deaminase RidA (YjgF/YER057c/UK114 family) [Spelaeicoccus albus]
MASVESAIADLGLALPEVVPPVASYVPAVVSGDYVYTAGQLPMIDGKLGAVGKVAAEGGDGVVDQQTAADMARVCALNALAAVKSAVGDLDKIVRVVKVVGFVASDPSFTQQPQVVNGASDLLGKVFGDRGVHARSAVGVAVLPMNAPVEVELIVQVEPS